MSVKLLTEHHLEVLSLKGGCTGKSESTLVKMPHCWKSHVATQMGKQRSPVAGASDSVRLRCTGTSESTLVKMPHCWKSHIAAQMGKQRSPVAGASDSVRLRCTGTSKSTLVKMPHCWKSHVAAQMGKQRCPVAGACDSVYSRGIEGRIPLSAWSCVLQVNTIFIYIDLSHDM